VIADNSFVCHLTTDEPIHLRFISAFCTKMMLFCQYNNECWCAAAVSLCWTYTVTLYSELEQVLSFMSLITAVRCSVETVALGIFIRILMHYDKL